MNRKHSLAAVAALRTRLSASVWAQAWPPTPTVIAHRGASALRPEHTLAAYQQAIVDGQAITGWFTEDFTLAELKTLRARERIPAVRPANVVFDGRFDVPTLQEVIALAKTESARIGRTIGIYPETKHPAYFQPIGLPLEAPLLAVLDSNGWNHKDAPVFVQSFEVGNLRAIRQRSSVRLVQLVAPSGRPYDFVAQGTTNTRSYADLITPEGLRQVATYANAIGPFKTLVVPAHEGLPGEPTTLVARARALGLGVHVWTLRPENAFLPAGLKKAPATDATLRGDSVAEISAYLRAGIDGFFTDDPAVGRAAVRAFAAKAAPPAKWAQAGTWASGRAARRRSGLSVLGGAVG